MTRRSAKVAVDVRPAGEVWMTIDRAEKHNALARATLAALAEAVGRYAGDAQTRFIVVRGAGDRYFAAGGDIVDLADVRTREQTETMTDEATAALDTIRLCEVPVIAFVNGDALGGGAELAVACDMRVFAAHARMGFIHATLAITPAWGGATDLCRLVGPARAMRMMTRCELLDAHTAMAIGLADALVGDDADLSAFLQPLRDRSPAMLRAIKAQVNADRGSSKALRRMERRNLVATWTHADHWRAVDRFLAREPGGTRR
jgi:enoyl-CoA hydratase